MIGREGRRRGQSWEGRGGYRERGTVSWGEREGDKGSEGWLYWREKGTLTGREERDREGRRDVYTQKRTGMGREGWGL